MSGLSALFGLANSLATATPARPLWTTTRVGRLARRSSRSRVAPATGARCDGSKMERGWGKPHHGQEVAAEARDFAGGERGMVAVVEA
jgi:hypothetical protein